MKNRKFLKKSSTSVYKAWIPDNVEVISPCLKLSKQELLHLAGRLMNIKAKKGCKIRMSGSRGDIYILYNASSSQ
ncbi:MAG: hypothetical protein AB1633_09630 [Elusimicrobiota bacterium]